MGTSFSAAAMRRCAIRAILTFASSSTMSDDQGAQAGTPALPDLQFWRRFMAQRKQASFSELRVGILVLSAVAILILVIFAVSGDIKLPGFGKTATVKT